MFRERNAHNVSSKGLRPRTCLIFVLLFQPKPQHLSCVLLRCQGEEQQLAGFDHINKVVSDSSYTGVLKMAAASAQFKQLKATLADIADKRKAASAKGKSWLLASTCFDAAQESGQWSDSENTELQKRIHAALTTMRLDGTWGQQGKQCLIFAQRIALPPKDVGQGC